MRMKLVSPYFPQELKYGSALFLIVGIYLAVSGHFIWGLSLIVLVAGYDSIRMKFGMGRSIRS
jgi:hypothetical protein